MNTYNHLEIEPRLQKKWAEDGEFEVKGDDYSDKIYILDMFPYPSGAGLHVGHPEGYTATDIISRYYRMLRTKDGHPYHVLHPMGWDAFGLPAENYAIKTKIHPSKSTRENIKTFTAQIKSLGFSYDWEREVSTCEPEYYKWTQWFFLFLYNQGLAYKKEAPVNWCESCKTVLANEQAVGGACDRCHGPIIQKNLNQWFFKITDFLEDYVDKNSGRVTHGLISGLDLIDWPESTKTSQLNWIGRKEGVIIHHNIEGSDMTVDTFSAFPAWLFADTFLVLAPEHPLVTSLVDGTEYEAQVTEFIDQCSKITADERNADRFEKKGIFTGKYALDPFNNSRRMPIWIANFALMNFGTGAIRCSAHDVRDYDFAIKYQIPLNEVVARTDANLPVNAHDNTGVLINSGEFTGREINNDLIKEMVDWIEETRIGKRCTTYKIRDWLVSRQRYWGAPIPIVYCEKCGEVPVKECDLPVLLPDDVDFNPTGESPLVQSQSFHKTACPQCGAKQGVKRESDTMDTFVCSSWYFFRFIDPKNDKVFADSTLVNRFGPVDLYIGGAEHTVLHLLYSRFFTKALHRSGLIDFDEPFMKLRHQGLILGEDGEKMSKSRGNVINPNEIVEKYGADTLRLYEMFMGPFKDSKPWNTNGVVGIYRFLQKLWKVSCESSKTDSSTNEMLRHQTIKKITENTVEFKFNTAVSQAMIFVNTLNEKGASKDDLEALLLLLHPYAPHITEELYENVLKIGKMSTAIWPTYDPNKAMELEVEYAVQVNGKLRATFTAAKDIDQKSAQEQALALENVKKFLNGTVVKIIFVPGKLINIVVKS